MMYPSEGAVIVSQELYVAMMVHADTGVRSCRSCVNVHGHVLLYICCIEIEVCDVFFDISKSSAVYGSTQ